MSDRINISRMMLYVTLARITELCFTAIWPCFLQGQMSRTDGAPRATFVTTRIYERVIADILKCAAVKTLHDIHVNAHTTHTRTQTHFHTHAHTHMHELSNVHVHTSHAHTYTSTCTRTNTHIHKHAKTFTHICTHLCTLANTRTLANTQKTRA